MCARHSLFSGKGRAAALATVVAVALTTVGPVTAFAGSTAAGKGVSAAPPHGVTDVSARRRVVRRGGGGAAAAAAFAGIVGTGIAIAAAQNRRSYYDDYDSYAGPTYYGGGPAYYGGGGYYGGYGSGVPYFRGHPNAGW